eukprot:GDKJ01031266.1.p1 GENE.GDKJ01031266.1~~GDKJ01031266.1.p1  ORF type:complete len:113 (+),score=30.41 GDKJ01031266.1:16-354(+)
MFAVARSARQAFVPASQATAMRMRSSIRFVEERGQAQESVFFKQQDDAVLKNLLSNHPEYDPRYTNSVEDAELGKLATSVSAVLSKHGLNKVNIALIKDLEAAFKAAGYTKN